MEQQPGGHSSAHDRAGAVLGISADFHDAAAALVVDGVLVAAAEQERFSRRKHDPSLPADAIAWCLAEGGIEPGDLTGVAYFEKPLSAYERVLVTQARVGPRGFGSLARAVSSWTSAKLWIGYRIERLLAELGHTDVRVSFGEHHQSHAASAFYPSPFDRAAVLTVDGVGEWATSSIAWGAGNRIEVRAETRFPDSLGLFYAAMTAHCGFAVNDGEYKLMGLAPYGETRFVEVLREQVIGVHEDGSIRLDQRWFDYQRGRRMTRPALDRLLDGPPRDPDGPLGQREADIARSIQQIVEDVVLAMARHAHELTGETELCLAGGVALNCVANARLLEEGPFDDIWVQPAAGDAGGAVGAALWRWHQIDGHPRPARPTGTGRADGMSGSFLGPGFSNDEARAWLEANAIPFAEHVDHEALCAWTAAELDEGRAIGWFQGRMEFGPRALGHRSILADARDPAMAARLNLAVKGREGFRPFAPAVLAEHASEWFSTDREHPYMTVTAPVHPQQRRVPPVEPTGTFSDRLAEVRSTIPACTHVDDSARVQTVDAQRNPELHGLLAAFHERTGCPVLLNTSFNRAGEPIVRTPADALRCFVAAGLDHLVIERCVVDRRALASTGGAP